jgi:NAD-dependent SIR2 family protein deacetylase
VSTLADARRLCTPAERILIATGAGMSADSGLPTYRGPDGIWTTFDGGDPQEVMTGEAYHQRPAELWARHRAAQEQRLAVVPHVGYDILAGWTATKDVFVLTSNVDGLHERSGAPGKRIHEVHGSSWWMQCRDGCGEPPWPRPPLLEGLPHCACGAPARLNIVLFRDRDFDPRRRDASARRLREWQRSPVDLVLEIGAGSVLRTVRRAAEQAALAHHCPLIRINLDEAEVTQAGWIGLTGTAADLLVGLC